MQYLNIECPRFCCERSFILTAAYSLDGGHKVSFADDGQRVKAVKRNE